MKHISKSLEETRAVAKEFLSTLEQGGKAVIVALQGDLGAGKTAFTQAVGAELGVGENMQSPTFVIMKVYEINPAKSGQVGKGFKNLIHIDAYRLERSEELLHLGWGEIVQEPENLIFIEWPENVASIIPADAKKIFFEFVDETTRNIEIHDA